MTALSDIIFPSQESTAGINRILGDLKRANLSVANRLRSIREDAAFVDGVHRAALGGVRGRPLVANERCGSWYVPPERKAAGAYFKSTDGHTGEWRFSTRRLNLHLLPLIEEHDGIIIVDSTRRGKRMPDALSKTIPIWCCVLNRVLFPSRLEAHDLHLPPTAVSASEASQILARIPGAVRDFAALNPDLAALRSQLSKPLRPTWVTPETPLEEDDGTTATTIFEDFRPVICCTASRRVMDGEMSGHGAGYVQGAGDDTENWAHGLTPPVFWAHAETLLATDESSLPGRIEALVAEEKNKTAPKQQTPPIPESATTTAAGGMSPAWSLPSTARRLTSHLHVSPLPPPPSALLPPPPSEGWCAISLLSNVAPPSQSSPTCLSVGLGRHKVASRNLRGALANICDFATKFLQANSSFSTSTSTSNSPRQILIACETGGRDLAVGVALALLCWCFEDDEGLVVRRDGADEIEFNKTLIKIRLSKIMTAMPDANPNRATLQSVNSFLMDWRK